jgi:hypothetical protein
MANQMIAQSASGKPLPDKFGVANYDPKTMRVSKFSAGDRMFDRGVIPPEKIVISNKSEDSAKVKYKRMFTEQNKDFYVYTTEKSTTITTAVAGTYATSTNFAGLANVSRTTTVTEKQNYILAENIDSLQFLNDDLKKYINDSCMDDCDVSQLLTYVSQVDENLQRLRNKCIIKSENKP